MVPERLAWLVADDAPAARLGRRFSDAGHELYLVGGSLRDALLGRPHSDLDFATDARPERIKEIVEGVGPIFTMGEAFGTIGVREGELIHEITTFREEVYRDDSRKPGVTFSDEITTDLSRRDFTVNAIALKLPAAEIVDPFDGLVDMARRELRTPLTPEISFTDDPLRMLRLYRFVATLDFEPDPAAERAVVEMAGRLEIVSSERIRDELSKLLVAPSPARGLRAIVSTGLADYFLPELRDLVEQSDPLHRHKDVWEHTLAVVEKTEPELRIRLAALLHDIGKPATREFVQGGVTFHHHEVVGARMARARLRSLRYPKSLVDEVGQLVFLHLRPHTFKMGWTDSAVRRYVRDAGDLLDDLNQLVRCDVTTGNQRRADAIQRRIDELEERIEVLGEQEELARLRPPIDGNRVMEFLGIPPGPAVGTIMKRLMEHRIEHGPFSEDEALELVAHWGKEQGIDVG
ncbi:MAG: CCA tRNA nucleotidyltransferase [Acidimicrobiia bacterium]|nr:CCA tRNA nucleotidyltransferase [Acidimicrobiia bacterium]